MSPSDPADLLRRIGELAAMPESDVARRRLEREIADTGGWAETAWRETLDLDSRLRLELRRSAAPAGLLARLRSVPDRTPRPWYTQSQSAIAAAALLAGALTVIALGPGLLRRARGGVSAPERVRAFARAVLDDHLSTGSLDARDDPIELQRELSDRLGYEVVFPALPGGWELDGGRVCDLNGRSVAYSRWGPDPDRALFVFRARDYRLPETIEPFALDLEAAGRAYVVRLWTEQGRGFATVEPGGSRTPLQ